MSVKIYHNPRCSKSRQALELLQKKTIDLEVILYLEQGVTTVEVLALAKLLDKNVMEFVRTKDELFEELKVDWNDNHLAAKALAANPRILERPIVINGNKAVIARPPQTLESLF